MRAGHALLVACSAVAFLAVGAPHARAEAPAQKSGAAGNQPIQAKAKGAESWYAATVAEDESGGFLIVHFWSRGHLFRSEAVIAGRRIVTIVNSEKYYVVDAVAGQGISIMRSQAAREQDATRGRPFANELELLLREGGERIEEKRIGGQTVTVYRVTDDRGRRTLWMSQTDPEIPLRVVTYDRASATTGKVDYVNWLHQPSLPLSWFEPDPRWKLEEFSYEEYRKRTRQGPVGPAPVLYRHLLHGESD
jgi:hypothetical protein